MTTQSRRKSMDNGERSKKADREQHRKGERPEQTWKTSQRKCVFVAMLSGFILLFMRRKFVISTDPVTFLVKELIIDNSCKKSRQMPIPPKVIFPEIQGKSRIDRYDGCLRYECAKSTDLHCQDNFAPTNYSEGSKPPCCAHILRDIIQLVDQALCDLGLEYFASYGTLLGLVRNDHVIPWTADNDFVVSFAVANEMHQKKVRVRRMCQCSTSSRSTRDTPNYS